ncbi:MAG TPA: hypothetical protein VGK99_23065 [Acidobacteriota bacterium]|jgi:hypothetical protein
MFLALFFSLALNFFIGGDIQNRSATEGIQKLKIVCPSSQQSWDSVD